MLSSYELPMSRPIRLLVVANQRNAIIVGRSRIGLLCTRGRYGLVLLLVSLPFRDRILKVLIAC